MNVQELVTDSLSEYLDEDVCAYVTSLLEEEEDQEETREAVLALVESSLDDTDHENIHATTLCTLLFDKLSLSKDQSENTKPDTTTSGPTTTLRKLEQSVTLKEHDVTSFASGLVANHPDHDMSGADAKKESQIQEFYANMIDVTNHPRAVSERARRKERQRKLRLAQEDEDRQQAIAHAAATMMVQDDDDDEKQVIPEKEYVKEDVHLRNFDLPNPSEAGGADLLSGTNLTLAYGRRYGLMGPNGCGKTTLLKYIASLDTIRLSMLLVRQEIIGNDQTAVETVLKSNIAREGILQFIQQTEAQLDALEGGNANNNQGNENDKEDSKNDKEEAASSTTASKSSAKGGKREKRAANLREKRAARRAGGGKQGSKKAAKEDTPTSLEAKKSQLADQLAKAHLRLATLEEEEGGDPEPRARKVLAGLGFSTEMQDKPTSALSGGWRMRVSLSCALFASPSLLILDEPTNHLDLEAVLWLQQYLTSQYKGTLLVVSHDRHFLNEVVTDVVHFNYLTKHLDCYRGDVDNYLAVREEHRQRQMRLRDTQEAKRAHLQKYIDLHAQSGENGVKAAKQRKSRMKKLDKLGVMAQEGRRYKASYDGDAEEVEEIQEEEAVTLSFPDPGSFDGNIVQLEQASFSYNPEEALLLENVDMTIDAKSRVALLGRNGSGKSTLIKLLVGALQPTRGKATIDGRAKIEYLAQHQLEQLDPDSTPLETMLERYPGDRSNAQYMTLRRYLANFGLGGDTLPKQSIGTMSGGQKCRLCLALAMYRNPQLIVLDEPTNHLSLETTEALIGAIQEFKGGVLLVSHDQHLLTSCCNDLYVVEKGRVDLLRQGTTNEEAFAAYKKAVIQGKR